MKITDKICKKGMLHDFCQYCQCYHSILTMLSRYKSIVNIVSAFRETMNSASQHVLFDGSPDVPQRSEAAGLQKRPPGAKSRQQVSYYVYGFKRLGALLVE